MADGFIKMSRNSNVDELMKDIPAFMLLTQIARRARRMDSFSVDNLEPGEALIGDYSEIGLTYQQYRSAKERLKKYGLATFKPTNKGTIAKLVNTNIYDINIDVSNQQTNNPATIQQQSSNNPATIQQPLTKKERKKECKNVKMKEREISLSRLFFLLSDSCFQEPEPTPEQQIHDNAEHFSGLKDPDAASLISELFTADHEPATFWRNAVMNDAQKFCQHYPKIRAQFKSRATINSLPFDDDDFTQQAKMSRETGYNLPYPEASNHKPTKGDRAVDFLRRLNS